MEAEAEEKRRLTVQTLHLDPGPTQRALGWAPDHPQKREVGQRLSLIKMNPTLTKGERAFINGQQVLKGETRMIDNTQAED
jgi:hypothetical protein